MIGIAAPVSATIGKPPVQQPPIVATGDTGVCTITATLTPVYGNTGRVTSWSNTIVVTLDFDQSLVYSDAWTTQGPYPQDFSGHLQAMFDATTETCQAPDVVPPAP